jgi:uncharacterized protein YuzE
MTTPSATVLVLVRDLMFAAKITATARAAGVDARLIREPDRLIGQMGDRLIVDLNQDGAIAAATSWQQATGRPVIGFVSHVDKETASAAKSAGINRVVARSYFVDHLEQLLAGNI